MRLTNTDQLKDEISQNLGIDAVAERLCGVDLMASGAQFKGLCPLHEEKTPSWQCNPTKGLYYCFGCQQGGDAIDLVRKTRHIGYYEALRVLAAEADIDIQRYERPPTEEEKEREQLEARVERWLDDLRPGAPRVADANVAAQFGVAVSDSGPDVGLPPGHFQGVVFPYRKPNGKLVGWKTREIDGKKMLGTPRDFAINGVTLFGIDVARKHLNNGELVIVEGEYDALACHCAGFKNVVALGGSNFSEAHMELLESIKVRTAIFALDGDEAGERAGKSIAESWWDNSEVGVKIATLPEGSDPDEVIAKDPLDFTLAIAAAKSGLEYLLWREWVSEPRVSLSDKLEFVEWIQTWFGSKLSKIQDQLVMAEVAKWLDLPETEVFDFARSERTNLQATDSERVVLARCLRDRSYYVAVRQSLSAPDFFMMRHQRIWEILEKLLIDGLDFDLTTIKQRAKEGGVSVDYVEQLVALPDANLDWHEQLISDLSVRRSARDQVEGFRERISNVDVPANQTIGDFTHKITNKALGHNAGAGQLSDQVDSAMDTLHERMRNPTGVHGLELGSQFPMLSKTLQGFQPRRFVLVSASSGVGKSTLTLQFSAYLALQQSVAVDFISLEMDTDEILFKLASHMTGIDGLKVTGGALDEDEARRVEQAMARIRKSPLRIYAPDGMTPSEFLLYARESVLQRRTEAFVIDYAQLMSPDPGMEKATGYEQLGHFGRVAKMKVARAMDTTVICCAQLRRDAASKERPTREDMGDSYQLVRDADVILILKENEGSSTVDLWIDKNRQGPGSVLIPTVFERESQTFREAHNASRVPDYRIGE